MGETVIPYELHIDEPNDPEGYKMYNRQDATIVDRNFEDALSALKFSLVRYL